MDSKTFKLFMPYESYARRNHLFVGSELFRRFALYNTSKILFCFDYHALLQVAQKDLEARPRNR
jgi:hypothetical protein